MVEATPITPTMQFTKQLRIEKAVKKQNARIEQAVKMGKTKTCFECYDTVSEGDLYDDMKEIYERAGYKIKPTGYVGGVYQRTMDICW